MATLSVTEIPRISILGVPLSLCSQAQLLVAIYESIVTQRRITVLSGNIYAYNLAYENEWLRDYFNKADIVRLDGAGVSLGARILGYTTPPRMTWADFGWDLASFAARKGLTVFLLGAKPGMAERAGSRLRGKHPELRIVGVHHGYFDKEVGSVENDKIVKHINSTQPNILIIGFGMPHQERWLLENRERLDVNVVLTGGAVFDYIAGELRRSPRWMNDNGLEWLGRLLIEPRRLWRRYILGNPLFLWRVLKQRFGYTPN